MSVLCSVCGQESRDHEFCDHCNADLGRVGQNLPPETCPLPEGSVSLTREQRHRLLLPESFVILSSGREAHRVHWISNHDWAEHRPKLEKRVSLRIAAWPTGRFIDDVTGRWLIYSVGEKVAPWEGSALGGALAEAQRLAYFVRSLAIAAESLHQHALVWLNFDPKALEDAGPIPTETQLRHLRITNLDLDLFPFHSMPERVRVHPHYAAPEIVEFRTEDIGPRTDVYHLAGLTYYWLAQRLPDGLPGSGLESHGYALPALRTFVPNLPEGIAPVVMRGLAELPQHRFPTPLAFADALDEAIRCANQRRIRTELLHWDSIGRSGATRVRAEPRRQCSEPMKTPF
jgi:hypothetical protein